MALEKLVATIDGVEVVLFPVETPTVPAPIIEEPVKVDVVDAVGHDTTFVPEVETPVSIESNLA